MAQKRRKHKMTTHIHMTLEASLCSCVCVYVWSRGSRLPA